MLTYSREIRLNGEQASSKAIRCLPALSRSSEPISYYDPTLMHDQVLTSKLALFERQLRMYISRGLHVLTIEYFFPYLSGT